jgi:large subunit ribosomal protein L17
MKKRIAFRKLGRTPTHKWAMLRNLVSSLIEHERVVTTLPKAKEVRNIAEKLITTAKGPDKLHARRQVNKIVRTPTTQTKLIEVLGPRYEFRQGGYTRIMKMAMPRHGDKADMAVIEYVDRPGEIRAARPPSMFANRTLDEVFKDLAIQYDDATENELEDLPKMGEESSK